MQTSVSIPDFVRQHISMQCAARTQHGADLLHSGASKDGAGGMLVRMEGYPLVCHKVHFTHLGSLQRHRTEMR